MTIEELLAAQPEIQKRVLRTFSYREREILKVRHGLGDGYRYTLEEVGHIFKVTPERIAQIEKKALRKLGNCSLETFVDAKFPYEPSRLDPSELKVQVNELSPSFSIVLDAGTASPEAIAELFAEMSKLYRMVGGSGVRFDVSDSRSLSPAGELV